MNEDLINSVDEIDVGIINAKQRKKDWKDFLKMLRKRRMPTGEELGMILSGLTPDEQKMFSTILLDIEAEAPTMTTFQKKFLALGLSSMMKIKDFENNVLDLALEGALDGDRLGELEIKTKLLDVLERKNKYLMEHITKHNEIKSNASALDEILNDPELLDFQLSVKKKSYKKPIKVESIEDADFRVLDDEE